MKNGEEHGREDGFKWDDEKLFRLMVESISDYSVIAIDPEGRIMSWNKGAEKAFGYRKEEIVGESFAILFALEDRSQGAPERELETAESEEGAVEEGWRARKDGSRLWVSGSINALKDDAGNTIGYVKVMAVGEGSGREQAEAVAREALERERMTRSEFEDASRSKDEFIALVSHELRSPLNAILGWTRILRQGRPDEELYQRATEIIERSARMQSQLIEDLMDTARIVRGKLKLEVHPVNLAPLIEKAMDVVRPAADAKDISLEASLDREADQITGDPDRLQQVVWNLLSNAVKFTNEGGRVEVRLGRVDPYIQISVSDTGCGVSPEFMPYLFERYRQADASGARRKGGLGLGLTLVRQLVEMHGGSVTAESEGEGKGATFIVKLPVRAVYTAETERPTLAGAQTKSLDGVWAAVVDDEANARELITSVLESYGAQVTAFASAGEALELLTSGRRPDVLVCDLAMPGEDGFSLIHKLREWEKAHDGVLPAVALTAFGRVEDRTRALYAGFQMHIAKPVEPVELVIVVRSLIERGWQSKVKTGQV
ncbi:MAG TPA: ATP-binding protein [Blastocatellia bacterium]|jgi:PAS domain S-box-containing protein|nr:ATP-binding protein [Blastocatellia bacterium]